VLSEFDVLVLGAGPSGSEAAWALARRGFSVGLLSDSLDSVYRLEEAAQEPPAGGLMAAAWSPDPWTLQRRAKYLLEAEPRLHLFQSSAAALLTEGERVRGVRTWEGLEYLAGAVVLAVGSFLGARLQSGDLQESAGRWGEAAYPDLYRDLRERGFEFAPAFYEVPARDGAPRYRVDFMRFSAGEWDPESFALRRYQGLFAVGRVTMGGLEPSQRARAGMRLGGELQPV